MSLNGEETYKNNTPRTSPDFERTSCWAAPYRAEMFLIWLGAYVRTGIDHPNYSGEKGISSGIFIQTPEDLNLPIWISGNYKGKSHPSSSWRKI